MASNATTRSNALDNDGCYRATVQIHYHNAISGLAKLEFPGTTGLGIYMETIVLRVLGRQLLEEVAQGLPPAESIGAHLFPGNISVVEIRVNDEVVYSFAPRLTNKRLLITNMLAIFLFERGTAAWITKFLG